MPRATDAGKPPASEPWPMIETQTDNPQNGNVDSAELRSLRHEVAQLNKQNLELRNEVAQLRNEKQELRQTLDAYISRACSPGVFEPLEMTAGTSVGPRRQRPARSRGH